MCAIEKVRVNKTNKSNNTKKIAECRSQRKQNVYKWQMNHCNGDDTDSKKEITKSTE